MLLEIVIMFLKNSLKLEYDFKVDKVDIRRMECPSRILPVPLQKQICQDDELEISRSIKAGCETIRIPEFAGRDFLVFDDISSQQHI